MPTPTVLVDTDVVSYLFKRDSRAQLYERHLRGNLLVISFMSVAELDRWAIEHNWGRPRRDRMEAYLQKFVIHPYDRALCAKWAEATVSMSRKGRTLSCADAWIAATALLHNIPLVTHNRDDYAAVDGLTVISELR